MTTTDPEAVAPVPPDGPATVSGTITHLGLSDAAPAEARLVSIVAAVNARVRSWPVAQVAAGAPSWYEDDGAGGTRPVPDYAHVVEGATMLAARLYRRKNSPAGVEAFGDLGPVYVQRNDPDVAFLLQLGTWTPPGVA